MNELRTARARIDMFNKINQKNNKKILKLKSKFEKTRELKNKVYEHYLIKNGLLHEAREELMIARAKSKDDKKIIQDYRRAQTFEVLRLRENVDFLLRTRKMRQMEIKYSSDDGGVPYRGTDTNMKIKRDYLLKDTNGKVPPMVDKLVKQEIILYNDLGRMTKKDPHITKTQLNYSINEKDWTMYDIIQMFSNSNDRSQSNNNNSNDVNNEDEDEDSVRTELLEEGNSKC